MSLNFDLRITKKQAEIILSRGLDKKNGFTIMCKEYGDDNKECDCNNPFPGRHTKKCSINDWVGLEEGDLDEEGKLSTDWKTLEIWYL